MSLLWYGESEAVFIKSAIIVILGCGFLLNCIKAWPDEIPFGWPKNRFDFGFIDIHIYLPIFRFLFYSKLKMLGRRPACASFYYIVCFSFFFWNPKSKVRPSIRKINDPISELIVFEMNISVFHEHKSNTQKSCTANQIRNTKHKTIDVNLNAQDAI